MALSDYNIGEWTPEWQQAKIFREIIAELNAGVGAAALLDRGNWATATVYAVGDVVTQTGQRHACRTAHTAGTFATDLAASKWVTLDAISSTAGGDLSGTLPSPTVAKVNGVAVSGTPSSGKVLTATGSTAATWQAATGGSVGTVVTPESQGAAGDGVLLVDGAITSGSASFASASAVFTSGDVGKRLWVNGAGAAGDSLHTSISAFVDSTHVTLAATAGTTVSSAYAVYGTDDTAAVQAAVDAVVAAKGGTVQFSGKIYVLASTPRTDRGGNAVVALPNTPNGSNLAQGALNLAGVFDMASYWPDGSGIAAGTVLFCPVVGRTYSSSFGPPSVIGGPTIEQVGSTFSRHQVAIGNLAVMVSPNPSVAAVDLTMIVRARIRGFQGLVACAQTAIPQPTHNWAFGVRMPTVSNYDQSLVETGLVGGFYVGWVVNTEHFTAVDLIAHRCRFGLCEDEKGGWHASVIQKFSCEWCPNVIAGFTNSSGPINPTGPAVFNIALLDIEEAPSNAPMAWMLPSNGNTVTDVDSYFTGVIAYSRANGGLLWGPLKMSGGNGLQFIDLVGQRRQRTPDFGPLGMHAMLMGDAANSITQVTGPTGFSKGLSFNGNSSSAVNTSCIEMGTQTVLQPNAGPFTVECKIKRTATSSAFEVIGSMGNSAWTLALSNANKLYLALNGSIAVTSTGTITADGNWHDVAGVWDGTTAYVFIDGTVTSAAWASAPAHGGETVRFGSSPDGTSRMNGAIDEIRISNTARYTSGYTPASTPFAVDANTLGLWHCDVLVRAIQPV